MTPANLAEALELAPLPYPTYQNLGQWDDFQPYSIAHLLVRSDGTVDERWDANIEKRSIRGFASCDLWNLDKFFSYLIAYTVELIIDGKVVPVTHANKVKTWCRGFVERVEQISRTKDNNDTFGSVRDEIFTEFFADILPNLPRDNGENYVPVIINRNTGLSEQDYAVLGSHLIYVMCNSMGLFFNEFVEEYHDDLRSSINMLHTVEQGVVPTKEQVEVLVDLISSLWV